MSMVEWFFRKPYCSLVIRLDVSRCQINRLLTIYPIVLASVLISEIGP